MDGYVMVTANNPEEEKEEENTEENNNQPAKNPIVRSSGWGKKARRGHARKGWGTWLGMKQGWRLSPKTMKKTKIGM